MFSEVLGGLFLGVASDFSDHHDALRLGIVQENLEAIDEVGAVERVPSNSHAQRLSEPSFRRLVDSLKNLLAITSLLSISLEHRPSKF